jgi:hypothetical protein
MGNSKEFYMEIAIAVAGVILAVVGVAVELF